MVLIMWGRNRTALVNLLQFRPEPSSAALPNDLTYAFAHGKHSISRGVIGEEGASFHQGAFWIVFKWLKGKAI
jgi:hypothetical protein